MPICPYPARTPCPFLAPRVVDDLRLRTSARYRNLQRGDDEIGGCLTPAAGDPIATTARRRVSGDDPARTLPVRHALFLLPEGTKRHLLVPELFGLLPQVSPIYA